MTYFILGAFKAHQLCFCLFLTQRGSP